jgi:cardiolipin synthase A/B
MTRGKLKVTLVAAAGLVTLVIVLLVLNILPADASIDRWSADLPPIKHPDFSRLVEHVPGSLILSGNQIVPLNNGDEIFPAMLEAIRGAQRTINFESFIYWSGEISEQFQHALVERAQAGVEVRILLDWVGSLKSDSDGNDALEQAGVRIVYYRPPRWYSLARLNHRTHRKLLIVDGEVAFTGGVGIGDEWMGNARNPNEWREIQFLVRGPAVGLMQAAFLESWIYAEGEVFHGPGFFPELQPVGPLAAQLVKSAPHGGRARMRLNFMLALAAARERIVIAAPYFIPDDQITAILIQAAERGVIIDILEPGEHTDTPSVRAASRHRWGPLLQVGIRIHTYQPTLFHAKVMVIDGYWTSIGSANFNNRSFRYDDEANLNVFDADFAAQIEAVLAKDFAEATPYTLADWENRPLRRKLADAIASSVALVF